MNRLSPLIVRRTGRSAPALALPLARTAAMPTPGSDDLRRFGMTFLAGLVFFSAYIA
jgi:hypothetical protein